MARHARPIDSGPTGILDLDLLTVPELGALMHWIRQAQFAFADADNFEASHEMIVIRMEIRPVFMHKLLES